MLLRQRKKKYSLTLLELSIALFLTGILLSTLWGLYHHWMVVHLQIQKQEIALHKWLFIKLRLEKLLERMDIIPVKGEQASFLFSPPGGLNGFSSVCFSYLNGPDPEFVFNGQVRSLLYINENKKLCLTTWAFERTSRTEILLDSVSSFSLSFFDPQTNLWREDWPDKFAHRPLWMKVDIETTEKIDLIFRLSPSSDPIFYLKEGASN
jgi:hypothetical protein